MRKSFRIFAQKLETGLQEIYKGFHETHHETHKPQHYDYLQVMREKQTQRWILDRVYKSNQQEKVRIYADRKGG